MQRYSFFLNWRIIFCETDNLSCTCPVCEAVVGCRAAYFPLVQLHLQLFFVQVGLMVWQGFSVKNFAKVRKKVDGVTASYRILRHFTDSYGFLPHFTETYRFLPIEGVFAVR